MSAGVNHQGGQSVDRARAPRVAICVCTFRRPDGLTALLEGLRDQRFQIVARPVLEILVADNEAGPRAAAICARFRGEGLPVRYLAEPRRGISFARNRCLDEVPADFDFVAMIDDDETPAPDWLDELLLAQGTTGADAVQGRVDAEFSDDAPAWIRDGGFFGYPPSPSPTRPLSEPAGTELNSAATNNVLVRAAVIRDRALRFDERLGLTGGGDALFFRSLKAAGYRIVYAANAVVRERIAPSRTTLGYLWRRSFRNGTKRLLAKSLTTALAGGRDRRTRLKLAGRALAQAFAAVIWLSKNALRGRTDKATMAHGIVEIANAAGTLVACAGGRYEIYGRSA